jgi:hypothetical protein
MNAVEIAKILNYTKPSKIAKPKGFSHRMEEWESIVLEFCQEFTNKDANFVKERFLTACGFYEDFDS